MRAFLKGDSTLLSAAPELQKYSNGPSFAAPKRIPKKLLSSTQRSQSKIIDENEYAPSNLVVDVRNQNKSKESQSQRASKPLSVLQPSHNRVKSEFISAKNDIGDELPKAKTFDQNINLNQLLSVSSHEKKEKNQSGSISQNADQIVVSLVGEVDRLNQLLLEKINENEDLKLLNVSLEKKLQEFLLHESNENSRNQEVFKKYPSEASRLDTRVRSLTQATLNTEEDSKENIKEMNKTFASYGKSKNAKKSHLTYHSISGNEKIKGIGSALEEKSKIEELNISLARMNSTLKAKEEENNVLSSEIMEIKRNYESMAQKILQYQQVTEKLRTELMNSHAQNQELSHRLTSMKSHIESPKAKKVTTISFSRIDSPKASFSNQEINEWQQKFELTKKDNERLIKMVEENQKVIQSFKAIFTELEKRHNINYDTLKGEYEQRLKSLSEGKSASRTIAISGRTDTISSFSATGNSFAIG